MTDEKTMSPEQSMEYQSSEIVRLERERDKLKEIIKKLEKQVISHSQLLSSIAVLIQHAADNGLIVEMNLLNVIAAACTGERGRWPGA
jgi:hypothetical protein